MKESKRAKSLLREILDRQFIDYSATVPALNWDDRRRAWHIDSPAGKLMIRCKTDADKARIRQKYIHEVEAFRAAFRLTGDKKFIIAQLFRFYREIRSAERRVSYRANLRTRAKGLVLAHVI